MVPAHLRPQCRKMHMNIHEFVPKGKGKGKERVRRRVSAQRQFSNSLLGRTRKKGCLNDEELELWSENYSLPDRHLRACEAAVSSCFKPLPLLGLAQLCGETGPDSTRRVSISNLGSPVLNLDGSRRGNCSSAQLNTSSTVQQYSLSLSRWVRWQTAQTHFKKVGPSERSKQFVSLLEFLDLMHSSEGLAENYDAEMAAFLNEEDVSGDVKDGKKRERGGKKTSKGLKRRRLPDSLDEDFEEPCQKKVAGGGRKEEEITTADGVDSSNQCPPEEHSEVKTPQKSADVLSDDVVMTSQHVIHHPPYADSLDWLDSIEPS